MDCSHVLWLGGAPDSGKTTIAMKLAERYQLQIYHYDRHDLDHHQRLAMTNPVYELFLAASLDERWITPDPEDLFQRMLASFRDRFSLLIEDLVALPREQRIIVEGFGLLPELLALIQVDPARALWLVPTQAFKLASMQRRNKPSFGAQVSDPERAKLNVLMRDQLLTEFLKEQVSKYGYSLHEVDGSRTVYEMVDVVELHYKYLLDR
jgi:2-phosphoglycerate kinase